MVSPVHGDYRRCQAEIPLIILCRFPGPALIATVTSCFITNSGRSAWFIGALLLFIYAIFAMTLYMVPPGSHAPV
jgi:hypothetical protein